MNRARLVRLRLLWRPSKRLITVLIAVSLFAAPNVRAGASVTSQILMEPVGVFTGDVFGCSVAWIGESTGALTNRQIRKMIWLGDWR
jgi:hypothetical protein